MRTRLTGCGVAVGAPLGRVGDGGEPPEVVVEGAVLHHHDHEVVDREVARTRERRGLGLRRLAEQDVDRQQRCRTGEPGGVGGTLEELASGEPLVAVVRLRLVIVAVHRTTP